MTYLLLFLVAVFLIRHLFFWKKTQPRGCYGEKPILIAHRGSPKNQPENTISSFQCAIKKGFRAIEMDVCSTKDGKVVCSHNYDLERETDGVGFLDEKEQKHLASISTRASKGKKKQAIPMLLEVAKEIPKNILFNVEIKTKSAMDIGTAIRVALLIRTGKIQHNIIVSSFNPLVLLVIKIFSRKTKTGYLFYKKAQSFLVSLIHPDCIHPEGGVVTRDVVKKAHKRGQEVNVWTINSLSGKKWLKEINVDGIITDDNF